MRATTVKPLGLRTAPNKHGMPPGALSKALNVCMRDPGVISSLPDVRTFRADVVSAGYTLRRLWAGASSVLAIGDNAGTWAARWVASGSSTAITLPSSYTLSVATAHGQAARMRDRWIATTTLDPLVFDSEGDASARMVGIAAPEFGQPAADLTDAQALADQMATAYRAIIRRVHSDGYETISAPSQPLIIQNDTGGVMDPMMRVRFPLHAGIIAGDIVELYRARAVAIDTTPGDTLFLATRYEIASGDVAAGRVDIYDRALEDSLSEELYTNPSQETINKAKTPPAKSSDVAAYRGRTFYAMDTLPSKISVRVPGTFGSLSTTAERAHGIGHRVVTGTSTLGSPDVTGISDTTGIVPGQDAGSTGAFGGAVSARVLAVVGTTITFDTNAIASGFNAFTMSDVIEINGNEMLVGSFSSWNEEIAANGARVTADNTAVWTTDSGGSTSMANVNGLGLIFQNTRVVGGTLTLRATNGQNYSPALPEIDETAQNGESSTRANRYASSLDQQPEAVPLLHYGFVGAGTLYRMIPTKDALYMWCSDGLHRLTGDEFPWQVDPVDPTLILAARNAVDVLGDTIWAYTNRGLVAIENDAVREVSTDKSGDASTLPGAAYTDTWDTFLTCDELHREVWLTFRSGSNSVSYVYNTLHDAFTTVDDDEWSAMTYSRALQSLVIGAVSSNPDVLYFESDTSSTRMPGAELRFQPFTAGDPFTLKEFVEVDHLFEGASSTLTLVPSFDGTSYTAVSVTGSSIESHGVVPVPRNAPAVARRLAPGFTLSAGGTAQRWSYRGLSVSFLPAADEADR